VDADESARAPLRESPLQAAHIALGAKMVPFGGWEMPLAYPSGTVAEHRTCRTSAVAFDVSHLGTVRVLGADAFDHLQRSLSNDLFRIHPGRAQYTHLLDDDGFVVDDIIVWWVDEERFDVMPNASNTTDVLDAIGGSDVTDERAVIAVQGPQARARLAQVSPEAATVHRFAVERFEWGGAQCLVAGTGYTGEEGVECAVPAEVATGFWEAVLGQGVAPAGLGARDTLRLEAGLPLHGHELGPGITPLQAGLGWVIGWGKGDFTGRAALEEERANGPARRLRGFVADGRQPLRDGSLLCEGPEQVGILTSGNFSPMRERGIGLGFVDADARLLDGDAVTILQRGRELPARLVRPPLWPIREEEESE
jgi:aminomethyltransferase